MVFCAADTAGAGPKAAANNTGRKSPMESSLSLSRPGGGRWSSGVGPGSLPHGHRDQPIDRGPAAELAGDVAAPAIGGARGRNPARVIPTGVPRGEADPASHEARARPAVRGPVAEL